MSCVKIYRWCDSRFTDFALWVHKIVEERNLLRVPESVWAPFRIIVITNFIFAALTFLMGVICFSLGLHYSTFYTRINCNDGINIWIPLNNLVATWTGLFAIKALHIRWAAFTHFVFTIVMTPMMVFASGFATSQVFVWQEEQRLSRGDKDWGTENSNINVVIALISYIDVALSIAILCVYAVYWIPRNVRNNAGR